jgi:regulator of protease activity HflC (stomatin/prohibitin superfamily)
MFHIYLICILLVISAMLCNAVHVNGTAKTTYERNLELDAALQKSIETQVLAGTKHERVLQYCIEQSMRYRQKVQQQTAERQEAAAERQEAAAARRRERLRCLELCNKLSRLSVNHNRVRWADQQEELVDDPDNSDLWTPTEVDELAGW